MGFRVLRWSLLIPLLLAPLLAYPDTLIVGYPNTPGISAGYYLVPAGLPPNQAQQFTLFNGFDVSHIDVGLVDTRQGDGSAPATVFDFALWNSLTNPTQMISLGSVILPALSASQNQLVLTETINVNSVISAGTYYLVASTEAGGSRSDGWVASDGTLVSNGGTGPNVAFLTDQNGNWLSNPGSGAFAVYGSRVPEPGSVNLLATGVAGFALRRMLLRLRRRGYEP